MWPGPRQRRPGGRSAIGSGRLVRARANDPIRAAGGRRRINAQRQMRARLRQADICRWLVATETSLLVPGVQRALADRFGVSEATMSRDLRAIFGTPSQALHKCPICGSRAIDAAGLEAIEAGTERLRSL